MRARVRKKDAGAVISALAKEVGRLRRLENLAREESQADEEEIKRRREEGILLQELLDVLGRHVGETGMSEGAVETLHRLIAERDVAREKLEAIERSRLSKSASYGKHPVAK